MEFYKHQGTRDGLDHRCRACIAAISRERRVADLRDPAKAADRRKYGREAAAKFRAGLTAEQKRAIYLRNKDVRAAYLKRITAEKKADWRRKTRYGLTPGAYAEMLGRQNGVCAICKQPESITFKGVVQPLSIDHCHATGVVRGLLCRACNSSLGLLNDDPERILALARYIAFFKDDSYGSGHQGGVHYAARRAERVA